LNKFLPSRETIEAFGNDGFRFGGLSHQGSLLVLPSGMRAWRPQALDDVTADDFKELLAEKSNIDMLLIGSGAHMGFLSATVANELRAHAVNFDTMTTSAAIHIYNVVLSEGRRVAAALIRVADAAG
jgi:uncharacterized protein